MLRFDRNLTDEPYWITNRFWKQFISNESFDHAYFVDVFKTIVGDCAFRNKILTHFLDSPNGKPVLSNLYEPGESEEERLQNIRQCIVQANQRYCKAYITWEYPPIVDSDGNEESHCVMYIYDPDKRTVTSIDSRGVAFAQNFCTQWAGSQAKIRNVFKKCTWVDAVLSDMQVKNEDDHFCQTWSLILTIAIETAECSASNKQCLDDSTASDTTMESMTDLSAWRSECDCDDQLYFAPVDNTFDATPIMKGFLSIIQFWRELVSMEDFRQALYYEVYRHTHLPDGEHRYNRYFTTLEALVNRSNEVYYPHNVHYKDTGYTFIEDFVFDLDEATLRIILS